MVITIRRHRLIERTKDAARDVAGGCPANTFSPSEETNTAERKLTADVVILYSLLPARGLKIVLDATRGFGLKN